MNSTLFLKFKEKLSTLEEREYIFALISYHIAPTLEGLKAASIITMRNGDRKDYSLWKKYRKDFLKEKRVECLEVKKSNKECILMFYNRRLLNAILNKIDTIEFLKRFGYIEEMGLEEKLLYLRSRFSQDCPHEMGIFLGFPLEDVEKFIDDPKRESLMVGYWKVYNDVDKARQAFEAFEKCKDNVMEKAISNIV